MSDLIDPSQCRALIAELAALLPPLFKKQAERRIVSFGADYEHELRRTRWDPVFAGGGIVQFLLTDPAAPPASMTKDVDAVIEIASYGDYAEIEEALRVAGFEQSFQDKAAIVAWYWKGRRVDILPHKPFPLIPTTNRWFPWVLDDAVRYELMRGQFAWIASAPSFLATKFEAFFSRGAGDYVQSKDIEDIIAVVDGRTELDGEIQGAEREISMFLRRCFSDLLTSRSFMESLQYLIPDDGREAVVIHRMKKICFE